MGTGASKRGNKESMAVHGVKRLTRGDHKELQRLVTATKASVKAFEQYAGTQKQAALCWQKWGNDIHDNQEERHLRSVVTEMLYAAEQQEKADLRLLEVHRKQAEGVLQVHQWFKQHDVMLKAVDHVEKQLAKDTKVLDKIKKKLLKNNGREPEHTKVEGEMKVQVVEVANTAAEVARVEADVEASAKDLQAKKNRQSAQLLMDYANAWGAHADATAKVAELRKRAVTPFNQIANPSKPIDPVNVVPQGGGGAAAAVAMPAQQPSMRTIDRPSVPSIERHEAADATAAAAVAAPAPANTNTARSTTTGNAAPTTPPAAAGAGEPVYENIPDVPNGSAASAGDGDGGDDVPPGYSSLG